MKPWAKCSGHFADEAPIRCTVGKDQNYDVSAAVALALPDSSGQSLYVANTRLKFHADELDVRSKHDVPGPSITHARKWHFTSDAPRAAERCREAADQGLMTAVDESITIGVQASTQVVTECGRNLSNLNDGGVVEGNEPLEA